MTPIDVISALRDSIYSLEKIEDMRGISDMHNLVSRVKNECLIPALAVVEAEETRICLGDTLAAINMEATEAARNDPGVLPVLRALDCKVAKLTVGE